MGKDVLISILNFLKERDVDFVHLTHDHVHSSKDAALVRGNSVEQAAKAIVLKCKNKSGVYEFVQYVVSGHRKIDFKSFRKVFGFKSVSLASPEEVLDLTGCVIGSVPPIGPFFGLKSFLDVSILDNEYIFFSAGTHNDSVKIKSSDFKNLFDFEIVSLSVLI
ncbi:hypothetical protein K9L97_05990 [Candidatus Woesearchaeota archaeon]|nr:hypothetical protein [Candidatus Woesearchaeota archaeon]